MEAFLRADPPERDGISAPPVRRVERVEVDAVLDVAHEVGARRTALPLRCRDALQVDAGQVERRGRVPPRRQMQRREHRNVGTGCVVIEIDAVEMHHVDRLALEGSLDRVPCGSLCARQGELVDGPVVPGQGNERPGAPRALLGDDQRTVTRFDESAIDCREDLLGTAHGVRADRRQRVRHVQHGQPHGERMLVSRRAVGNPLVSYVSAEGAGKP